MSVESKPSSEELKKYLKDASLYEENMDYEDMLNYYKVVKCSESTAQQEQEQRSFHENLQNDAESNGSSERIESTSEYSFDNDIKEDGLLSPKIIGKTPTKSPKMKLSMSKLSKNNSPSKGDKIIEYNAFESPPLKHKPLDIILYERKYDIPPHCNPKLNKLTTIQRAKIIHNFHRTILEKFYKLHCESLNPAPWGRPIPSSDKFNSTIDRNSQIEDDDLQIMNISNDDENTSSQEIYTSRHGRQTKRKVYTDCDVDGDTKKSKRNDDKPFEIEKKPVPKRQNSRLSNHDIMKRSKLFTDPVKTLRADKIFELFKETEKKGDVDKQPEKHESSSNEDITSENDNDVDIIPNSQQSDDVFELKPKEMPFIARRVPPPVRGRRAISSKRLLYSDVTKANGSPISPTTCKTSTPVSSAATPTAATTEKSQKSTTDIAKCPICSETFFQDEIEAHASSCGLFTETESNFDMLLTSGNLKKINCDVCDKEMIMNQDYEVHVKDCIRKAKANEKL